jgi:hypothetical protein
VKDSTSESLLLALSLVALAPTVVFVEPLRTVVLRWQEEVVPRLTRRDVQAGVKELNAAIERGISAPRNVL